MTSVTSSPSYADAGAPPLRRSKPPQHPSSAVAAPHPSPFRPSSTVAFSWEHRPGIPKASSTASVATPATHSSTYPFLPLPPLRCRPSNSTTAATSHSRKGRSPSRGANSSDDPFAAAFAECSKEPETDLDKLFRRDGSAKGRRKRTTPASAISGRFVVKAIYGSCKATCAVSESTMRVPRSRISTGAYDILNRPVGK